MKENRLNFEEIQDAHLDEMVKLAFLQMETLETQEMMGETDQETKEEDQLAEKTYEMFLAKWEQEEARRKSERRAERRKRVVIRFVELAACLVLVIGISTPFAVANVSALRSRMLDFLVHFEDDHLELGLNENQDALMNAPEGWKGSYYPAYIPAGYKRIDAYYYFPYIEYVNEQGQEIDFTERTVDVLADIDSETAHRFYADVNGWDALVVERNYPQGNAFYSVMWTIGDQYFVVRSTESAEQALAVARSVRKIVA